MIIKDFDEYQEHAEKTPWIKRACICGGRHPMPQGWEEGIFDDVIEDPLDFDTLSSVADGFVYDCEESGFSELSVIVTGFTPATIALIMACVHEFISIVFWHYDKECQTYRRQDFIA